MIIPENTLFDIVNVYEVLVWWRQSNTFLAKSRKSSQTALATRVHSLQSVRKAYRTLLNWRLKLENQYCSDRHQEHRFIVTHAAISTEIMQTRMALEASSLKARI